MAHRARALLAGGDRRGGFSCRVAGPLHHRRHPLVFHLHPVWTFRI